MTRLADCMAAEKIGGGGKTKTSGRATVGRGSAIIFGDQNDGTTGQPNRTGDWSRAGDKIARYAGFMPDYEWWRL